MAGDPRKNRNSSMPVQSETEIAYQPSCQTFNWLFCRHIARVIDRPTTRVDFDNIRWYLMHENIQVGIDQDNSWLLEAATPCRHLQSDHRCGIYETRPFVCREFPGTLDSCEHEDKTPVYRLLFTNGSELVRWMEKARPSWKFGM